MNIRRLFAIAGLGMGLMGVSAFASTITQTFTVNSGTQLDISGTAGQGTFNYFKSACPSCSTATLNSVKLQISVTGQIDSLSVTNTNGAANSFEYLSFVNLATIGSAPTADKTALKNALSANGGVLGYIDLIDTGTLSYNGLETKIFAPPAIAVTDDSGSLNAASIAAYNTTSTFTLGFTTKTFSSFSGGGGNTAAQQTTTGGATISVIYDYTDAPPPGVPEPATMALMGSALVGLGFLARKKSA